MKLSEVDCIERFFAPLALQRDDVLLGIGDDGAIVSVPEGYELVISTDTLTAGVHFPHDATPEQVAKKALSVNLSDLAAMGAEPAWFTLCLSLPEAREPWLAPFAKTLSELSQAYQCALIGGDTTQGPVLSISIQIQGFVPKGQALRRDGARPGDLIYVTGTLGDAALALRAFVFKDPAYANAQKLSVGQKERLLSSYYEPTPRLALGQAIRGLASAAIDVSDGLVKDLGHILQKSQAGARIECESLPVYQSLNQVLAKEEVWGMALSGGDDYELCFTVPPAKQAEVEACLTNTNTTATVIGAVRPREGLEVLCHGRKYDYKQTGFDHFR